MTVAEQAKPFLCLLAENVCAVQGEIMLLLFRLKPSYFDLVSWKRVGVWGRGGGFSFFSDTRWLSGYGEVL